MGSNPIRRSIYLKIFAIMYLLRFKVGIRIYNIIGPVNSAGHNLKEVGHG